jgi:hypothetical protein
MRKLSSSDRKFIRREKARIRRGVLDLKGQDKLFNELYKKFYPYTAETTAGNKNENK